MLGGLQAREAATVSRHAQYVALRDGAPVSLDADACLELRSHYAECSHCSRNCPQRALRFSDHGLELADACLGCGRCVAACPTGALKVSGFSGPPRAPRVGSQPLTIDCWKVPDTVRAAHRVPCLGGLPVSAIVGMCVDACGREVEFRDRGWCTGCPAGKATAEHPLTKSLERARARLRDAGVPERLLPRLAPSPLPVRLMTTEMEPTTARRRGSRRGFLVRTAATQVIADALGGAQMQYPQVLRPKRPSAERAATLAGLRKLAARHGGAVSTRLFHALEVGTGCHAHGVCASHCPTGALQVEEGGVGAALSHDAEMCIGCGHCARVCPERAIRVRHGEGASVREVIARFALRECGCCGEEFRGTVQGDAEHTVCDRCAKSQDLARSAFQQLFQPGTRTGV